MSHIHFCHFKIKQVKDVVLVHSTMTGKSLGTLYDFYFFLLLSFFSSIPMLLVVEKMPANFKQHCLVGKRKLSNKLLEVNKKIYYVYFVEWRMGDHLLRGGVPSTVATHCRYKKRVHLQLNQSVKIWYSAR